MKHNPFSVPKNVPRGVKILTLATSIRYFGWGLGEALIPIFLYQFAQSYAETGLISSIYSIGFFLTLPLIGMLQDRLPTKKSLLLGLYLYPLVGIGYLFAGLTGAVIFLVLARFINGIGFALYNIGASTYIKRNSPEHHVAANTGFFLSVSGFAWAFAIACSIPFVPYVPVHWLLFAIVPTHIIAFFIVRYLEEDKTIETGFSVASTISGYLSRVKESILHHRHHAKRIKKQTFSLMLTSKFMLNIALSISGFLLPLFVFQKNQDVFEVILMAIVMSIPATLAVFFGEWVDRNPVKSLLASFALLFPVVMALGMATGYSLTLGLAFFMGIILEVIDIGIESVTTAITPKDHYGSATTLISATDNLGDMVGPILLGISMDLVGIRNSLFLFSTIIAVFFIVMFVSRNSLRSEMELAFEKS